MEVLWPEVFPQCGKNKLKYNYESMQKTENVLMCDSVYKKKKHPNAQEWPL